ncbi:dTDP-4-dehydrorhamnose reductase [Cohnella herbarum]|uniref:dTDP-4-dehydrorhamnose reductase n=1 Tax=Cohnella herbarum TaxID=2728023 RepID=A0A7Z2VLH4_9BACL|nr:dTDP-4-dehydrorhamnose reductase [Cohnella herbarum]QJD85247.1 dTDP-4-dehydrorhamnose reductase [Cohnella herbarum]
MNDSSKRILVTGAGGQLGQEFVRLENNQDEVIGCRRSDLDITNAEQCRRIVDERKPDVILHVAAYTAVDRAEIEPDLAYAVNVTGTKNMAEAAERIGAIFCYISTDYVFDGMETMPYEVSHPTDPRSVYGRTKLEGEQIASETCSKVFIVRTSWVYGKYGNNFVKTMLRLANERQEISVVNDQFGAPTYTYDLAVLLAELVRSDQYGTYHVSNEGVCTWFEFAQTIFKEAGIEGITVRPCSTLQFPRPAPRPAYSVLSPNSLIEAGFKPLRHWKEALRHFLS